MNKCSPAAKVYGSHTSAQTLTCGSKTLPFTGLDLGFVLLGAVVLIGLGLSLRRVTRRVVR